MNLKTALSLSLNNLMTKKGRTILTAFAGSIGIIVIALILSLSNGVQEYIDRVQKETLSSYPLSIESNTIDLASMMENITIPDDTPCDKNSICTTDNISNSPYLMVGSSIISNNLKDFKTYLENHEMIKDYVTDIQYTYDLDLQIYSKNSHDEIVKVNPNIENMNSMMGMQTMTTSMLTNVFKELINSDELLNSQYEVLEGSMPKNYNELVLIVDEENKVPLSVMYSLDIENRKELSDIITKLSNKEEVDISTINYDYKDLVGTTYKLILNSDYYNKENNIWVNNSNLQVLYNNALDLKVVGILKVREGATATSGYIGYTHDLTEYVINEINKKDITKEQINNKDTNILTGQSFDGLTTTYENNIKTLGIADLDNPKTINIYPKDFDSKELIEDIIKEYNSEV